MLNFLITKFDISFGTRRKNIMKYFTLEGKSIVIICVVPIDIIQKFGPSIVYLFKSSPKE